MGSTRNLSIRTKLSAGFGLALALILLIGGTAMVQLLESDRLASGLTDSWLPEVSILGNIKRAMNEHKLLATRMTETRDFHQIAAITAGIDRMHQTIVAGEEAYQAKADTFGERRLIEAFRQSWAAYEGTFADASRLLDSGRLLAANAAFREKSLPAYDLAAFTIDELLTTSAREGIEAAAAARRTFAVFLVFTIGAMVLAAAGVGGAVLWINRSISRPILRISTAMRKLAAGDDSVTIERTTRTDEIGDLAAAFEGYRASLNRARELSAEADTERERFTVAVKNMSIGLCMFDADDRLVICNPRYAEMYNLPPELTRPGTGWSALAEHWASVGNFAGADQFHRLLSRIDKSNEPSASPFYLQDGRVFSIRHHPMAGGGWVATHEDVTERRQIEARVEHMARHDALTDLPNRVLLREKCDQALAAKQRDASVAVLCLDLDHFKTVNDTLGHPIGDALLREVAKRLRACVRDVDTVGRLGGDEFAVVQVGSAQPDGAMALAQRVIDTLAEPLTIEDHHVVCGVSIGIALAPADGDDANVLLKNGDLALYRAKADGRGIYRFFEPEMDARMQERRVLELDLRQAIVKKEFELHYQPLTNLATGNVSGFEALLRWRHPQRGMVQPLEFIPLAEEVGLIVQIGEWVLKQACLEAAKWPRQIAVAVNLSPVQFRGRRVVQTVVGALAASGLAASRLELEITESVLLGDTEGTLSVLHQLRSLGVRISMDDFGTGYSSLSYLRRFPFDKIKIDQSFIHGMSDVKSSLAIIRAVTGLGSSLGITTTAEGVETEDQLERVRAEGCGEAQGFLISKPMPASDIGAFMQKRMAPPSVAA